MTHKFIEHTFTEDTGVNLVDFVQLKNGMLIEIDGESVVLYPNLDAFYGGIDGVDDFPSISFSEAK